MKKLALTLLFLLLLAAIIPFTLPLKEGKPLLQWDQLQTPQLKLPPLPDLSLTESDSPEHTVTSYKWQDAAGNWHLSDAPPVSGDYTAVTVNPNTNIIAAPEPAAPTPRQPPAPNRAPEPHNDSPTPTLNPAATLTRGQEVMEQARQLEQTLQQRQQQLDQPF